MSRTLPASWLNVFLSGPRPPGVPDSTVRGISAPWRSEEQREKPRTMTATKHRLVRRVHNAHTHWGGCLTQRTGSHRPPVISLAAFSFHSGSAVILLGVI